MLPPEEKSDDPEKRATVLSAVSLGTNMAVGMAFFTAMGYYADKRIGSGSAFTLGGIFLGLFYGGYEVWKTVRRINEEDRKTKRG